MPPKRKPASEVPVQEVSSPKKPKQEIDNVFDVPTADVPVVEPATKKKARTPRKPRTKKQAPPQEPVVAEPHSEGQPSSGTQIPGDMPQEPPPPAVKKPRKPRTKKQAVQEVHRDPLSIENLLIHTHQEPETSPIVPDNSVTTPEKKPRKPRAKKQDVHSDPLAIDNLLIHTPQESETAQIIPQFINVTDAVSTKKPRKSRVTNKQPSHEEDSAITTNQQEIEPQELTEITQEQPVKKQRKPRAKKQESPREHSVTDNAISSNQPPIETDSVINNAQQVFDVQMKPKTSTRAPRTKKSKASGDARPELDDASSSILDNDKDGASVHTDENVQKASSSTKRGRPRKEKVSEVTSHDETNTDENTQRTPASKRGRPRKGKNSEIIPSTSNDSEVKKEDDGTSTQVEEHLQKASTKRGRPRKEKPVETNSPDEHPVESQTPHVDEERPAEEESTSSRKRRGRPKKDDIPKAMTQSKDSKENTSSPALIDDRQDVAANKSPVTKKKRNKKSDGLQDQQLLESIDHSELSKDLHPVENSSSIGDERVDELSSIQDSRKELLEPLSFSDNRQNEVDRGTIQDPSYPPEGNIVKEEFQHYYGNSLDVLASVSVGDTMMQGVSTDKRHITKNATEEKVGGLKDAAVINAPYSTSSQLQQLTSEKEVTRNFQITENETNKKTIEQDVMMGEVDEGSGDDSERESPKKQTPAEKMKGRFEHLQKLRSRMDEAEQANRQELYDEHQRKKINPREMIRQERKREEAEKLLARQEAEEKGEDYERKQFWNYSVDSVEKWEKKQEKKLKRSDIAFTDYNQVAHKKYKRMINDFVPDIASYNAKKETARESASLVTTEDGEVVPIDAESRFYRDANSLQYASVDDQPSREAVDRLVIDVEKQIDRRERFSRQKTVNEDDDITYINERNRKFNEKIGRFYDKYTQEIKENFERGTAL